MTPIRAASAEPAYIAVGSNLGNRRATIESGLSTLASTPGVSLLRRSALIETDPVGPAGQGRYLNGAAAVETTLSPRALLESLLAIETRFGRQRHPGVRNGPRTLDLDLLLFGDRLVDEAGLHLPHPRMAERVFVLRPLLEIASDEILPDVNQRLGLPAGTSLREGLRSLLSAAE